LWRTQNDQGSGQARRRIEAQTCYRARGHRAEEEKDPMTDLDLERFRAVLRTELADVQADIRAVQADTRALRADVTPMRAHLDGMPMLQRNLTVTQQEVRALKAAFNDFALTNPTVGEIDALHSDVNRVQAENAELAVKVATLERLVRELQDARH
jgi:hypothetical protein